MFWNHIPRRNYGSLSAVSVQILQIMRSEMLSEVLEVESEYRPAAARRNGLDRVEAQLRANGYPVPARKWDRQGAA